MEHGAVRPVSCGGAGAHEPSCRATSQYASRTNVDNNPSRSVRRRRELDSLPFRFTRGRDERPPRTALIIVGTTRRHLLRELSESNFRPRLIYLSRTTLL